MLLHNESMKKHCSLRAGGDAKVFFTPNNSDELSQFLSNNQKPVLFLGLGSNLLVRDRGFDGVVIKLKQMNQLKLHQDGVYAQAGVSLAKLARFCHANNIQGAEFLSAIPGTVGGALAMNAGAFGAETWQFVTMVKTINNSGEIFYRKKQAFNISYRKVDAHHQDEYFLGANFHFDLLNQTQDIKTLLKKRNASQPTGLASCGSVFKNPKDQYAAKLIEACQLKGFCIGGACISNKHANFIINQDHASATDIENLIQHIQLTVKSKFGIDLETEVVIR